MIFRYLQIWRKFNEKKMEERLRLLEAELKKGKKMMSQIERDRNALYNNMLRISGAIQILKEVLANDQVDNENKDIAIVAVGK